MSYQTFLAQLSSLTSGMSSRQLVQVLRRIATQLDAGIDMRRIWQREADTCPASQRPIFATIAAEVADGGSLHEAVSKCGNFFPPMVVDMIGIGESTGRLETVLARVADHYEHMIQLKRMFFMGIAWPVLNLIAAVGIITALILILGAVSDGNMSVLGMSGPSGAVTFLSGVILTVVPLVLAILGLFRGWFGSTPIRYAMQIPLLGNCIRTMALSRMAWTFALTQEAGVDARKSMELSLRATQNVVYQAHRSAVDKAIVKGSQFHEALRATGAFPREFLEALKTVEISGMQSEMMRLSEDYQERARLALRTLTMLAGGAVWGLMVVFMVFMIINMFLQFVLGPIQEQLDFINAN